MVKINSQHKTLPNSKFKNMYLKNKNFFWGCVSHFHRFYSWNFVPHLSGNAEQDRTLHCKWNLAENGPRFNSLASTYRKIVKGTTALGRSAVIILLNPAECVHTAEIGVLCKYLGTAICASINWISQPFQAQTLWRADFQPPWGNLGAQIPAGCWNPRSSPSRHFKMTVLGISTAFCLPFLCSEIANRAPSHFSCKKEDGFAFTQESW